MDSSKTVGKFPEVWSLDWVTYIYSPCSLLWVFGLAVFDSTVGCACTIVM